MRGEQNRRFTLSVLRFAFYVKTTDSTDNTDAMVDIFSNTERTE